MDRCPCFFVPFPLVYFCFRQDVFFYEWSMLKLMLQKICTDLFTSVFFRGIHDFKALLAAQESLRQILIMPFTTTSTRWLVFSSFSCASLFFLFFSCILLVRLVLFFFRFSLHFFFTFFPIFSRLFYVSFSPQNFPDFFLWASLSTPAPRASMLSSSIYHSTAQHSTSQHSAVSHARSSLARTWYVPIKMW